MHKPLSLTDDFLFDGFSGDAVIQEFNQVATAWKSSYVWPACYEPDFFFLKSPRFQALKNSDQAVGLNICIGRICP